MILFDEKSNSFLIQAGEMSIALHAKGMLFGLWMEPEVVHKDSPLVKEHPQNKIRG